MSIEAEVLARIKPSETEEEHIRNAVFSLRERVTHASAYAEAGRPELCLVGSIPKGTHLSNPDIDLFMLFDPAVPRQRLEMLGVKIGKEAIGGKEHYAEHPYIRGEFMGLDVDIVPAYKVVEAGGKMTAVDRTPFHTEYVMASLKDRQKDEVRLLKRFMKGIGAYGAEIRTEGFSGYLCELLVIKYGTFAGVLEAAAGWSRFEVLHLDTAVPKKFKAPLTFIDPVDPNRNVASPVSIDTAALFVHAARDYLAAPSLKFFFPEPVTTDDRGVLAEKMEHRGDIIAITLPRPDIIDDILYGQIKKFVRNVSNHLTNRDFNVLHSGYFVNGDIIFFFELSHRLISLAVAHRGPPVWVRENASDFLNKWKGNPAALSEPYIADGSWHVITKRKYRDALELIRAQMSEIDIGKDLNALKPKLEYHSGDGLLSPKIIGGLSRFLDKRMPWER